jgi:hypothetical protein
MGSLLGRLAMWWPMANLRFRRGLTKASMRRRIPRLNNLRAMELLSCEVWSKLLATERRSRIACLMTGVELTTGGKPELLWMMAKKKQMAG